MRRAHAIRQGVAERAEPSGHERARPVAARDARPRVSTSRRPHRVLMLLENNPYPLDGRVRMESLTLAAAGYQVTVIAPRSPGQPWRETLEGVDVYRYPAPPSGRGVWSYLLEYGWSMVSAFALSAVVFARRGFDVVHAHNPPDTFVFIAALYKVLGTRFVFDHHDLAPELYGARFGSRRPAIVRRLLERCERWSCRFADLVVTTNESCRRVDMDRSALPASKIAVVRNGPDPDLFSSTPPEPRISRPLTTRIVYVGIMGVQDGVDGLLTALRHLADDRGRLDFRCVIAGDGDARPDLEALATSLGLGEVVEFAGWKDRREIPAILAGADICVDPSPANAYTVRSTAIKLMEYMAAGRPAVAFDLAEHRVTAGDAALYAKPGEPADFARQLSRLIDDPDARRRMGAIGLARIASALAWPYQARRLLAAYDRLLAS